MTKQVILIDPYTISFMEAKLRRDRVEVDAFIRLPRGKFNAQEQPTSDQFSELLRGELKRLGWKPATAVLVLSPPLVIERSLVLPKTSPSTLPAVVQLQVEAMPLLKLKEPVFDYGVQSMQGESTLVDVTVSSRDAIDENVNALQQSGFSITSVTSCFHALTTLADHLLGSENDCELLVLASDRRVDVIAFQNSRVLSSFSESIFASRQEVQQLLPNIVGRCIRGIRKKNAPYEPKVALLMLDDAIWTKDLIEYLKREFEIDARAEDYRTLLSLESSEVPLKRTELVRAESAVLAGALLSQRKRPQQRVDLLHPKRVKSRVLFKTMLGLSAASILAFLGIRGYEYVEKEGKAVDLRLINLQAHVSDLEAENKESDYLLRTAEVVEGWQEKSIPWIDELASLQRNLPAKNEAYIRQLNLRSDKDSEFPSANAVGFAKKQSDIMAMNQRLSAGKSRYELEPRTFFYSKRTAPFVHQFELELQLKGNINLQNGNAEIQAASEEDREEDREDEVSSILEET